MFWTQSAAAATIERIKRDCILCLGLQNAMRCTRIRHKPCWQIVVHLHGVRCCRLSAGWQITIYIVKYDGNYLLLLFFVQMFRLMLPAVFDSQWLNLWAMTKLNNMYKQYIMCLYINISMTVWVRVFVCWHGQ